MTTKEAFAIRIAAALIQNNGTGHHMDGKNIVKTSAIMADQLFEKLNTKKSKTK